MYNYKMILSYDGTKFLGWQKQLENTDKTIQGKLEKVLSLLFEEPITLISSGRTDTGVHAKGQVANFHTTTFKEIPIILDYLAQYLPKDLAILELKLASDRFHARYNCIGKCYCYTIDNALFGNPFTRHFTYHCSESLDLVKMKEATQFLIGQHDFRSFTSLKNKKKSTIRHLRKIEILEEGPYIKIFYEGDGFLQHMVRILSGTLIEVGLSHILPHSIPTILSACDRSLAGPTAPAQGLSLEDVYY